MTCVRSYTYTGLMETIKNKIARFYHERKRMPSLSEITKLIGAKSKTTAVRLIKKLQEERFVFKDSTGKLLPGNLFNSLKFLGLVEAGFPSAAEEELTDTMTLDEYLMPNKDATYMLKVKGDSMIDAGIMNGDMVLVERTSNIKEGQIVIAEVDGEWTIKYYRKKNGKVYLEPANKKFKPIYPTNELKVTAVVRAVIRKY